MNEFVRTALTLLLLAAACAPMPTYDELLREAVRTQDWSRVERYERRKAERAQAAACQRQGLTLICDSTHLRKDCRCGDPRSILEQL